MSKDLYSVEKGKEYIVTEAPDIKLLSSIGIFKGARIKKDYVYRFGGPVSISLSTRKIAIGKDIAEKIQVKGAN
ncbi:MAG: FeoA family protein [Caldicoprobacterales bacterium]|jgi:Fe2+ transport system protein FeoA|nr:ferrous iron transport protein A [Clostridiales bacterium]